MKKQFIVLFTIFMSLFFFSACFFLGPSIKGNGHVTTEYRSIKDFDKIKVSTGLKVILQQSDKELVTVQADENLHDVIRTELKRGELNIFTDERIKKAKRLLITVEFKTLEELQSSSGSQVSSEAMLQIKRLNTRASSGSQQRLEINAQNLEAKSSSGAQVHLVGKTRTASLSASSGSHLKAARLESEKCVADVSSGAHIYIQVTKDFDGEASSGGHVYYSGNPASVNISTSSGGNIIKE